MYDDKIKIAIQKLIKIRDEINDFKKDKRKMEKEIPEDLKELMKSLRDLKEQVKDKQDEFTKNLQEETTYQKLREMIVNKEEEIAEAKVQLWQAVSQIPQEKNISMDIKIDEARFIKLQTERDIRVYLNGKEEKKA